MSFISIDRWFFQSLLPLLRRTKRSIEQEDRYRRTQLVIIGRGLLRHERALTRANVGVWNLLAHGPDDIVGDFIDSMLYTDKLRSRIALLQEQKRAITKRRKDLVTCLEARHTP